MGAGAGSTRAHLRALSYFVVNVFQRQVLIQLHGSFEIREFALMYPTKLYMYDVIAAFTRHLQCVARIFQRPAYVNSERAIQ